MQKRRTRPLKPNEWILATIYGSATGLIGVLFFVALIYFSDEERGTLLPVQQSDKPANGQVTTFYASQHGAFSNLEAATQFLATYSTLNKAVIVEVAEQFYIWSSLSTEKVLPIQEPVSFAKLVTIESACTESTLYNIPMFLKDEKYLNINFEQGDGKGQVPNDWMSIIQGATALSEDLSVIRLHVFAHYYEKNECLKIQFE